MRQNKSTNHGGLCFKTRIVSMLLCIVMVLGMLPMSALAETITDSGKCGDNLTWKLYSSGTLVITGTGAMYDYDYDIHAPWYQYSDSMKALHLDSGITHIGDYAFEHCQFSDTLYIPKGVVSIGEYAFQDCSQIPRDLTIPNTVTEIGNGAFQSCSGFTGTLRIPESVSKIGLYAFEGAFSRIVVDDNNQHYKTIDGMLLNKDGTELIQCPRYLDSEINIPVTVVTIGDYALSYCSDSDGYLVVPESVKYINDGAFDSSEKLVRVDLSEELRTISTAAFNYCTNLTSVVIHEKVDVIMEYVFNNCSSLTDVYYTGSEEEWNAIEIQAENDELLNATIHFNYGSGVVASGYCGDGGDGKNLKWTLTEGGVLTISGTGRMGESPWSEYKETIRSVVVEEGVTTLCPGAFGWHSNLVDVSLPNTLEVINLSFRNCTSLTEITIPDSVTSIVGYAFRECTNLSKVKLPAGLTSIPFYLFTGCTSLTEVILPPSLTTINKNAFDGCESLATIDFPESLTAIGSAAFRDCNSLVEIKLPKNLTFIDTFAFSGCKNLRSVYFSGNAPSVTPLDGYKSFSKNVTLYYTPGTTGWTDSDAYDAEAGTWNGYKLATWDPNNSLCAIENLISYAGNYRTFVIEFPSIPTTAYLQFDNQYDPTQWLDAEYCQDHDLFKIDPTMIIRDGGKLLYTTTFRIYSEGVESNGFNRKVRVVANYDGTEKISESASFTVLPLPERNANSIGFAYEQTGVTEVDVDKPSIKLVTKSAADDGSVILSVVGYDCDVSASPFFWWEADGGTFYRIADDFTKVGFCPEGYCNVTVHMGDGLGYVTSYQLTINN